MSAEDTNVIDFVLSEDDTYATSVEDEGGDHDAPELDDVLGQLRTDVEDAVNHIFEEFEDDRERAEKYYNGGSDLPVAATNRSKYVATKVRDVARALRPDVIRTLMSTPRPVQYLPSRPDLGALMSQQTEYANQRFQRAGGYMAIYSALHTAFLHKKGIVQVCRRVLREPRYTSYANLHEMQVEALKAEAEQMDPPGRVIIREENEGPPQTFDVDVVSFDKRAKRVMEAVPLEQFFIDEDATSFDDYRVIGRRQDVTVGYAVSLGFDFDDVKDLDASDPESEYAYGSSHERRGYDADGNDEDSVDPTTRKFLLTEAYYRADLDGIGVPQLYRFWLGGSKYEYLKHERVDDHPFAGFDIDPKPFTVWGTSLFDLLHLDQDVVTSLNRAVIDNAHMTNNGRLAVHETLVNMDDVLNNEIGAPIRFRQPGMIQSITVPFTGNQLLPLMQYLDEAVENKSGATRASLGLDPNALQSTDKDAVRNTIAKAAGQVELMARNLAETGLKRVFQLLLRIDTQYPDPNAVIRLRGSFVPAPVGSFDPDADVTIAVGTGTATIDQQKEMLMMVKAEQEKIVATLGPANPIVSARQMYNTLEDLLTINGMYDTARYFTAVTPQVEQQLGQMMAQAAQQQKGQPDPTQGLVEAEKVKGQVQLRIAHGKAALDAAKLRQQAQIETAKMQTKLAANAGQASLDRDVERDRLLQELYLKAAEIEAEYAASVDTARITQEQRSNGPDITGQGTPRPGGA